MPLPKPQADESEDKFLHRCMGDEVMAGDYPEEKQRYAVCNKQWDKREIEMAEKWFPILKTGTHEDSIGRSWTFGTTELDRLAKNYDPAKFEAPIVIGHPKQEDPAFGWIEALKRDGEMLLALPKQLDGEFRKLVNEGRFKKISAKMTPDMKLLHVGFFGAYPTAIKDLPTVSLSDQDKDGFEIELAEGGADKQAQEARAGKYGIAVKEGGHVTKPSEWDEVDDDEFLDPVNYRYPCPDADQTRAAATYWDREKNQAQYSEAERKIITARLEAKKKQFKIGPAFGAANKTGGNTMSLKDKIKASFAKAVDDIPEEELTTESPMFSEAEVERKVEEAKKQAKAEGIAEGKKVVSAEFSEKERVLKKTDLTAYVDGLIKGDGKKGRALAAAKKAGLVEFMLHLDDAEAIEFASGAGKVPMLVQMKAILETLPQDITYAEHATKDKDVGEGGNKEKREKLILEFQEQNKDATYKEAVLAVSKEKPELFSRTEE